MKTVDADVTAALAQGRAAAWWAVKCTLAGGSYLALTTRPDGATIGGTLYTCGVVAVTRLPNNSNPTMQKATVLMADAGGVLGAAIRDGSIEQATVVIYTLMCSELSLSPKTVERFTGQVETPGKQSGLVELVCGPARGLWQREGPPYYSATCPYTSTEQCPDVATCDPEARTWADCGVIGNQDYFGGFRRLPPPGVRVVFLNGALTLQSGGW